MSTRQSALIIVLLLLGCTTPLTAQPAWVWETSVIDAGPVLGPSSLAVDGSNHLHIVYRDESSKGLKYATNGTGAWEISFIEPSLEAYWPSLAVDGNHHLHIVCIAEGIKYLTNSSGAWTVTDIGIGSYPSIAVDPSGHAHICYMGTYYPWYATNRSGEWVKEELFTDSPPAIFYPLRTDIAVDSGGKAYIIYGSYWDFPGDYLNAYATNVSGSWVKIHLPMGPFEYLALDPSVATDASDHVHITYVGTNSFPVETFDIHLGYVTNTTGKIRSRMVAAGGMHFTTRMSMAVDGTKAVHVAYVHQDLGSDSMLEYLTNAQGGWAVSEPLTVRIDGTPHSMGVDASGEVSISYIDTDKQLLLISGRPQDLSPSWPGTPAQASEYGEASQAGSNLFNHLAILLASGAVIVWLRRNRRQRKT